MQFLSNTVSATDVAKGLFELIGAIDPETDPDLDSLTRRCLEHTGIDESQFSDEVHYLRAFVVYYSTWRILGESSQGRAMRAAFMDLWDSSARTSSANMCRYNEFFRRLQGYVEAIRTCESALPRTAIDRVAGKFAELLGSGDNDSSRRACEASGSAWYDRTCKAVAEALQNLKTAGAAFTGQSQLYH